MHLIHSRFVVSIAAAFLGAIASGALAQAYPARPVRLVVAAPPGGGTDAMGRVMAQRLSERLGQPFVVENRGGGGGSVGTDAVVKAPPDGYTLLMTNDQLITYQAISKPAYDAVRDLTAVGLIGRAVVVVGVNASFPAKSVSDLVALARAEPGKYSYSSCGSGTPVHLAGELLNLAAHINLTHIPYRGCGPALVDGVSGQVPVLFNMLGNVLPFDKSGKIRLLAIAAPHRLPAFPAIPTIAEAGFPGFEAFPWYGIFAPAALPGDILARLNAEISTGVATPEVADRIRAMQFEPQAAGPEKFAEMVRVDLARWMRVVRDAKVKAD